MSFFDICLYHMKPLMGKGELGKLTSMFEMTLQSRANDIAYYVFCCKNNIKMWSKYVTQLPTKL